MTYTNWNKLGENNPQQGEKKQLQIQKQKSLHKMKVALDTFYNVLEPLEEYVEKSGNYPNFISKRQIYRKNIQNSEGPLENDEDLFLSNLYIFAMTFHGKPEFFMKVIQEDFYKWINAVGITAENSSEELKHFLIEINNILEGDDKKIIKESHERNKNVEIDPKAMVGIFAGLQNPLNKNRWQRKELEGKKWNEIPEEDRLNGDADLGKQAFKKIEKSISIPHQNFCLRYFGEKRPTKQVNINEMEGVENCSSRLETSNQNQPFSAQTIRWNLIINIIENKDNWKIKSVITSHNYISGRWYQGRPEKMIIHDTARIEYNQANGDLIIQPGKMYKLKDFNGGERVELEQVFGVFQTETTASSDYDQKTSFYQSKLAEIGHRQTQEDNDNSIGKGGIIVIGMVSALLIASAVLVKKQLNKKVKK